MPLLFAVDRALVLAVMEMPAAPVMVAMMSRAGAVMPPVMDGRMSPVGALGDGRRARPDTRCRGENAGDNEAHENQEASHGMDPSLWPRG
jgi:hypothetical protein